MVVIDVAGTESHNAVLFFHGGGYALGSAAAMAGLASDLGRVAGARVISVDYRLAPEHPFPAAVDDALAAWRGLLAARDAGVALPSSAVVMSPWTDLTLAGTSVTGKAAVDPAVTAAGLRCRAREYAAGNDPAQPLISPVFADLDGLPALLIQAGSHELLLDDVTRLAARA